MSPLLGGLPQDRLFRDAQVAMQVVDVVTGDEVYAWQPDTALVPASVMKVVTSAAALRTLGPAWRFNTTLSRVGEVDEDGVLKGDLYVSGTGDPTLVVEKLWKLVHDLQKQGVRAIDGDIIFDDSYFDSEHLVRGWTKKVDIAAGPAYFAPIGALTVNQNTACILVAPGTRAGSPARVELDTPSELVEIVNQVRTVDRGRKGWLRVEREIDEKSDRITFTVRGEIAADAPVEAEYRAVGAPLPWFMSVFEGLMQDQRVPVKGRYRAGKTPKEAVVVTRLASQPLTEVLNHMNKYSSNIMAESVLKAMGAEAHGAPGTAEKGVKVVDAYLTGIGLKTGDYTLVNGSGLSLDVRLKPSQINAVLVDMNRDVRLGPEYLASLSVAGVDGTLRRRSAPTGMSGRMRGKTGSINGIYCLAGFITGADNHTYAFTMLVNGMRKGSTVRALQDRFTNSLLAAGATVTGAEEGPDDEEAQGAEPPP